MKTFKSSYPAASMHFAHYIPVYLFNKAKSTLFLITDQQIHLTRPVKAIPMPIVQLPEMIAVPADVSQLRRGNLCQLRSKLRRAIHQSKVYKRKCTLSYMFNAAYMIQGSTWLTQYQWKVCPFYLKSGRKLLIWPKTELIQFCMHYKFLWDRQHFSQQLSVSTRERHCMLTFY